MKVTIVEYSQQWPKLFEQERNLLLSTLGEPVARIEHIGSTSVPRLASKPIIDIMVGLNDFDIADSLVPGVKELGYTYIPKYEDVMPDRRFFRKLQHNNVTHHVHMVKIDSTFWERHLLFRDYLRANPQVAVEYALLKKELALRDWNDSNDFAEAKTQFIKKVEEQARRKNV